MIETLSFVNDVLTEPRLSTLIVSVIVKSLLVLSATAMVLYLLRNRSAVVRSFILSLTVTVCLILPLLSIIIPAWQFSLTEHITSIVTMSTIKAGTTGLYFPATDPAATLSISLFTIGVIAWAIGAAFLLFRLVLGWLLMAGVIRRATPCEDQTIGRLSSSIARRLHLRSAVAVYVSDEISSPVTAGLLTPVILCPSSLLERPSEQREMSLTHELAHIKRRDTMWYLLTSVATALYWFNPLIWWCRRRLVIETEKACDDYVLMSGCDACGYAQCLLEIARQVSQKRMAIPFGATMAKESELEGRLMSIMSDSTRSYGVKGSVITIGITLAIALVLPLAGMQLQAGDKNTTDTTNQTAEQQQKQEQYEKQKLKKEMELKKQEELKQKQEQELQEKQTQKQTQEQELKEKQELKRKQELKQKQLQEQASAQNLPGENDFVALEQLPELMESVPPVYPEDLKKKEIEGVVTIQALVDNKGMVRKANVLKSSGNLALDSAAVAAAYKCKYSPGIQNQQPVASWISYKVTFHLNDEEKSQQ